MSFFDSASLVQIPSGVKDGVLYSVKPIDGSGDLTFSRGSDIEATRISADGYIQKAQVNLLLQSNSFNTTWAIVNNAVLTSGQADKDGGTDAWLIASNGTANAHISQSVTAGVSTLSVYAKAGTLNWMRLYVDISGANASAWFDLANGALGTSYNSIEHKIESIGSGWYRCILVVPNGGTVVRINPSVADLDVSQTTGNIYIQDAQVNYGLVAQTYQETTTAAVVSGITDNMPRLNYDPANPTCASLLLEPSRTNLIPQSEYFGSYTLVNVTATANATTSPEGVANAYNIAEDSANTNKHFRAANTTLAASTYNVSIFIKPNNCDVIALREGLVSGDAITYKFSTGTSSLQGTRWGATSLNVEQYAGGWYRVSANFTATSATAHNFRIHLLGNDFNQTTNPNVGTYTYLGDGTSGIFAYGMQCELGNYVSSMVPTYGSSATRTSEAVRNTGMSSIIGQTEGTIYAEIDFDTISEESRFIQLSDGTNNNRFYIGALTTNNINYTAITAGTTIVNISSSAQSSGVLKVAAAYANNDFVLYVNGTQIGADTTGTIPAMSQVSVGYNNLANNRHIAYGVNQALLFKTRLSNADLATLTSL